MGDDGEPENLIVMVGRAVRAGSGVGAEGVKAD
jgi:hypothetical protein